MELRCDCCGRYKMAEVRDGKVIIKDRRHRREHILVLTFDFLEKLRLESKAIVGT